MTMQIDLGQTSNAAAVASSVLFGVFGVGPVLSAIWWVLFVAWLIVLILWLRQVLVYGKEYREYQQTHGQPYQSPCERNRFNRVLLKYSRRLEPILRNAYLKCDLRKLIFFLRVRRINNLMDKRLNVSGRGSQKPLTPFWRVNRKLRDFLNCHRAMKTPNVEVSDRATDSSNNQKAKPGSLD